MIVYLIRNLVNGKCYVGQTTKSLRGRWKLHCSKTSTCSYLKNAIGKYGPENFQVTVLQNASSLEELNELEEKYISEFRTLSPNGYNLNSGGKNRLASDSTKEKMSRKRTGVPLINRRGIPAWNKGIKTGIVQTKEHVQSRINPATLLKFKPIRCVQTGEVFDSLKEAVSKYNLNQGNLSEVLKGKRKSLSGLSFEYIKKVS